MSDPLRSFDPEAHMPSALVSDFDIAKYGFGFINAFDKPFVINTKLGKISMGQNAGLCGGMTFDSLDYYAYGRAAPDALSDPLFDYLCERQTDSLDLPGGVFRFMSWQTAADTSTMMFGKRVREGISYSTLTAEWPKIRQLLDGGHLAPLGLIKTDSLSPKDQSRNHQVLAYGYDLNETVQILTLRVCDPNHPRDPNTALRVGTGNPDFFRPVFHTAEPGSLIRGFFLSNYIQPKAPPDG
jgi:hypothetical protein